MFIRTRDIEDSSGTCLRVRLSAHTGDAEVKLERRDQDHRPSVSLSLAGTEILSGFLMAARLSAPRPLPDEITEYPCPTLFRLECTDETKLIIEQEGRHRLLIDQWLWDRLYAELCLVLAHGREQREQHKYHSLARYH